MARLPRLTLPESFSSIRSARYPFRSYRFGGYQSGYPAHGYQVRNSKHAFRCEPLFCEPFRRLTFLPVLYRQAKFLFHIPRRLIAPSGQLMAARRRVSPLPATAVGRHQDKHNITNRANLFKTGLIDCEALKTIPSQAVQGLGAVDVAVLGSHSVYNSQEFSGLRLPR